MWDESAQKSSLDFQIAYSGSTANRRWSNDSGQSLQDSDWSTVNVDLNDLQQLPFEVRLICCIARNYSRMHDILFEKGHSTPLSCTLLLPSPPPSLPSLHQCHVLRCELPPDQSVTFIHMLIVCVFVHVCCKLTASANAYSWSPTICFRDQYCLCLNCAILTSLVEQPTLRMYATCVILQLLEFTLCSLCLQMKFNAQVGSLGGVALDTVRFTHCCLTRKMLHDGCVVVQKFRNRTSLSQVYIHCTIIIEHIPSTCVSKRNSEVGCCVMPYVVF